MKLIEWLLQSTPDGSTYLQVIILLIFFAFIIRGITKTFQEITIILDEEEKDDDKTSV